MIFLSLLCPVLVYAAREQAGLQPYIESIEQAAGGMTVRQMVEAGGVVMVVLLALSVGTLALVFYNFLSLKESRLIPAVFCNDLIQKMVTGREGEVKEMCEKNDNVMSRVVLAGLNRPTTDPVLRREAMEQRARVEISRLWRQVSYLSDIGTIAPLIGLLGTVIGMIQAFNVIAFQTAVVKPILLAGGVSKAMVTTAGGLILAIPALLFYTYFKGRVQNIVDAIETYYVDLNRFMDSNTREG
jgi:biopolymer transport protein ExbB